ncbi:MAG: PAS domain-containing sensor histidine kinase [Chloroflexi bacterium]|nr:PAS domain-containing sensor histidine kinase [Chloroflexota bacterium]MBU1749064.1 PAS domain-containing sensor histidine kinase [Chloroflexota bacterium]
MSPSIDDAGPKQDQIAPDLETVQADLKRTLVELRQEKAWTDHLLDAVVEGIVTLDRHGRITFFSPGAERITGWARDQVIGWTCDQVFHSLESDAPFSQLIPPPGQRAKVAVELRDGRQAILAITGARLLPPESGAARVALVFRDISEEEAVHRLMGHLIANVAHEFRTPLSALAASIELLLEQSPDLSAAELHMLLRSLHLGILNLQALVDNLLESASIETGHFRVHPRPCQLDTIMAEAVRLIKPLLDRHGQCLAVDLPANLPLVQVDPRRIEQVMVNLLSNASKYGPDDAEITVSAAITADWIWVTVSDRGPGVSPGGRDSLFRRFVRLDANHNNGQVGMGLGLSVVKAVVTAHGGQVGVADRPGGGSSFWFTLPTVSEP